MKKTFICLIAFLFAMSLNAQTSNDSIIVKNAFFGHSYLIDGNRVSRGEVRDILSAKPSTSELIRQSRNKKTLGYVFLGGGLGATAFLINDILKSKKETGSIPVTHSFSYSSAITAGVLVFGLVSLTGSNNKFKKAIKIYNSKIQGSVHSSEMNMNVGVNYLSLTYRF